MKITESELNVLKLNRQHLEKSALYNTDKLIISMLNLVVQIFIIYIFLFGGGLDYLSGIIASLYSKETFFLSFVNPELLIIIIFFLILSILEIPITLYKIFVIEERYGFNKMSLNLFFR
ncbi:MAG: hypothetical protein VYA22_02635, partial [Pseudomonadota bacterium]|nr:hypothetical protein [Pseudomonadota bacterium]